MLKQVIIIARHGPRSPIAVYEKLNDGHIWNDLKTNTNEHAPLTHAGVEHCKKFGNRLKDEYKDNLNLKPHESVFMSTNTDRTKNSAILVGNEIFRNGMKLEHLECSESMNTVMRCKPEGRKYMEYIRILHTLSVKDVEYYDEAKSIISTHLRQMKSDKDFFDILSTLECYKFENIDLPSELTDEMKNVIINCGTLYWKRLYGKVAFIGKDAHNYIVNLLKTRNEKFIYISSHDSVVFPLSQYHNESHTKIPEFCSYVKYEVFENENNIDGEENQERVVVHYDDVGINSFLF